MKMNEREILLINSRTVVTNFYPGQMACMKG